MSAAARLIVVCALVVGLGGHVAVAQSPRGLVVAVVDFYAPGVLPPVEGIIPEDLAADDLTTLLARGAGTGIRVLPREAVRQAESAMAWQRSDVLRFARRRELGRAVGADRLLIGWIERLDLDRGGGGGGAGNQAGRHAMSGFAAIRVQVFDVAQGRIVSEVQQSGYEQGVISGGVTARLLLHLLERIVPSLLPAP